jgi:hypothetical protein
MMMMMAMMAMMMMMAMMAMMMMMVVVVVMVMVMVVMMMMMMVTVPTVLLYTDQIDCYIDHSFVHPLVLIDFSFLLHVLRATRISNRNF